MKITCWRIVKARHGGQAFLGEGARIFGGRWNPAGLAAVYTAESLSLAALEIIVHLERDVLLYQRFVKIAISFEATCAWTLDRKNLPVDWDHLPPLESTQKLGRQWLQQGVHAVLKVPSAVIEEEHNYLINPRHPDVVKMRIGKPRRFDFDRRLPAR